MIESSEAFSDCLDGNYCNDNLGSLEQMQYEISILKDAVQLLLFVVWNGNLMTTEQAKAELKFGYRIKED